MSNQLHLPEWIFNRNDETESLSGDRQGEYSIRISKQYRICFQWVPNGPAMVEITDYH
jgi:plasmid maintenance system killer protein